MITIVGAGAAGVFMSILLAKRGYNVELYERATQDELSNYCKKRSFNITLYGHGVSSLKEAGIWSHISPVMLPLTGAATQISPHSEYIHSGSDFDTESYYAVSRSELLKALLAVARVMPGITFKFGREVISIDRHAKTMIVKHKKNGRLETVKCDVIMGSDGVNSSVRSHIQQGQTSNHSQVYAPFTYKQISLTPALTKKIGLDPTKSYTWTRKNASIIGHPELDGSFGALLMLPKNQGQGFASISNAADIRKFFTEQFPVLMPAIKSITESLLTHPESHFTWVKTSPWYYRDFMVLLGDAAHGFYPFFGQGTAAAFGDCIELARLIDAHGSKWHHVFAEFQQNRKGSTDIIGDMSNTILKLYQRSSKADYSVIYDKLESVLHRIAPRLVSPPLPFLLSHDPNHATEHVIRNAIQRKRLNMIGAALAVSAVTGLVALSERFHTS